MESKQVLALAIFSLVYLIILAGENSPRKLDRPAAGLLGGVLMVLCGVLSRSQALQAIDFGTLTLLLGMMIVTAPATSSGLLDRMAIKLTGHSGNARILLLLVCLAAGGLSALFVNDTICLIMTPMILAAARSSKLPAEPYLLALATSSNVGSLMTITGNPQNMLIGQSSGWMWTAFAMRMVPVGIVCLIINWTVLDRLYANQLKGAPTLPKRSENGWERPYNRKLARRTLLVMVGLLAAFLFGAPMDLAAMTAGAALIVWANKPPSETFAAVDWSLLIFFAGLFIVVGGVTKMETGLITRFLPVIERHSISMMGLTGFSVFSVIGSNLFSNVPFVMLLRGWVSHMQHAPLLWLMLAASSTLAGNLTLVGSVANLIVAQGANKECPLSFWKFLKVGVLTTPLTLIASILMLWLYGRFGWA